MTNITNTSQLNTFSLIRDILLTNTTISARFSKGDFYEYEPRLKNTGVRLPHIVIKFPETSTELISINNVMTEKTFEITILLKMDWEARSKAQDYSNAMMHAIELAESTFEASGYYNAKLELMTLDDEVEDMKTLVVGQFILKLEGSVLRE